MVTATIRAGVVTLGNGDGLSAAKTPGESGNFYNFQSGIFCQGAANNGIKTKAQSIAFNTGQWPDFQPDTFTRLKFWLTA